MLPANLSLSVSGWSTGFFRGILRLASAHLQNYLSQGRSDWTAHTNIASILCLSMLFSKISEKKSRTPLRRTLPRHSATPSTSVGSLNDHSRKLQNHPPNQAGDIKYSTLLRFVKRFSELFSNFLRKSASSNIRRKHRRCASH